MPPRGESRVPLLPDVPTMPELGYPHIVMGQWNGVLGPAATPRAVVAKLHKAIARAMSQEQVIQRLNTAAAEAVFSKSPQEYAAYVRGENVRWGKIIRDSGSPPSSGCFTVFRRGATMTDHAFSRTTSLRRSVLASFKTDACLRPSCGACDGAPNERSSHGLPNVS